MVMRFSILIFVMNLFYQGIYKIIHFWEFNE